MNIEILFGKIKESLPSDAWVTDIKFHGQNILLVYGGFEYKQNGNCNFVYVLGVLKNGDLCHLFAPFQENWHGNFRDDLLEQAVEKMSGR